MQRLRLLLVLLLSTAPAAPAAGAEQVIEVGSPTLRPVDWTISYANHVAGPRLAGEEVVWAARERGEIVVRADGPRGRRVIDRQPGAERDPKRTLRGFSLAAGPTRLAITSWAMLCPPDDESCVRYMQQEPRRVLLQHGPLAAPLREVVEPPCYAVRADIGGDAIGSDCWFNGSNSLFYVIEGDGTERSLGPGAWETPAGSLAGDLVAARTRTERSFAVAVARRATGRALYLVEGDIVHFDLAPDGTLAYVFRDGRAGWSSPAEPQVHELPGAGYTDLVIAGDRVALRSRTGRLERNGPSSRFVVAGLDGRVIAAHDSVATEADFDFDGRRLAYARRPCAQAEIRVWDTSEVLPKVDPAVGCVAPQVARRRVGVSRRGTVRLPFRCEARGAGGCAANDVVVSARVRLRGGGSFDRDVLRTKVFLEPGERASRTVRLPRNVVRRARSGSLEVLVGSRRAVRLAFPRRR